MGLMTLAGESRDVVVETWDAQEEDPGNLILTWGILVGKQVLEFEAGYSLERTFYGVSSSVAGYQLSLIFYELLELLVVVGWVGERKVSALILVSVCWMTVRQEKQVWTPLPHSV